MRVCFSSSFVHLSSTSFSPVKGLLLLAAHQECGSSGLACICGLQCCSTTTSILVQRSFILCEIEMDGVARIYDKFEKMLENILQDPCEPPVSLPLEFLRSITDDFSSKNEIGSGGYGVVYKGTLRSGKVIAVKKIKDTYPMDKDRWSDELNRVIGIMHENVVRLIGYCADNNMETITDSGRLVVAEIRSRFICFEYLSNGSLDKYISSEHLDLHWDKIYTIIEGICRGLHCLHQEKVVHLDLKPQNILMDGDMMPKIVDFGLARLLGEHKSKTYTQMPTGTLGYMAPEYLLCGKISPKADIFSLGVIMIEIITGSRNHPRSMPAYSMISSELNNPNSTHARLQQFTKNVLGTWRKIFEASTNDASVVEVYTHQLEQLIDIALKCTDSDEDKRPDLADILHHFSLGEAGRSSYDSNSKSRQVKDLLIVQPAELKFPLADPNKLYRSPCLLQLNNNTDGHVAFRILSNNLLRRHFIWPSFHFVPPGCRYTIAVTIRSQQNPQPSKDHFFTLESTKATNQDMNYAISRDLLHDHDSFFTKARDRGRQVQEAKLTYVNVGSEPDITIIPLEIYKSVIVSRMDVHPTEPWILISCPQRSTFLIWDYNTQDMAHHPDCTEKNKGSTHFDEENGSISCTAKFIAREKWIVVGCSSGYIKVYSYMTRRNLEGSKKILFSEIKSFKAHEYGYVSSLDIHQTGPYVVSAVSEPGREISVWDNPMDKIKLWDWEKGWELICTFNAERYVAQVKFNPIEENTFATIPLRHSTGTVKVWNICSADSESELPEHGTCLDFFSRDGEQYMILTHSKGRKATIWDYHSMTCVATLRGHTNNIYVAFSHPELPILFTGSYDGTVCVWNSSSFSLMGILNCGIGAVRSIASLKGSRRIAILHRDGLAITEMDLDQSGALVVGRQYESAEASKNADGCGHISLQNLIGYLD